MSGFPTNKRLRVYGQCKARCAYCGADLSVLDEWHVDHRVPRHRGGKDSYDNLLAACPGCNLSKYIKTVDEFRQWIKPRMNELLGDISKEFLRYSRCLDSVAGGSIRTKFLELFDEINGADARFHIDSERC